MQSFLECRKNSFITLRDEVTPSCELRAAISRADVVIISIPSQNLRGLMGEMRDAGWQGGKYVVDKSAIVTAAVATLVLLSTLILGGVLIARQRRNKGK